MMVPYMEIHMKSSGYWSAVKLKTNGHKRTDSRNKSYKFELCDDSSGGLCSIRNHLRMHTDEKPYSCNDCDYRGSSEYYLTQHMITYTSEKPF